MTAYFIELRSAEAIAREAGKRIVRERRDGLSIDLKAANDLVTNVDKSTERFIRAELAQLYPDDVVFGEEYGRDPHATGARMWLVDPIDGTLNFATGVPLYCVSIALQVDGQSVVGVIYDPVRDELFSAHRGHGAWLDGHPISVSDGSVLADSVLVTGFAATRSVEFEQNLAQFVGLTRASRGVRRLGSAAIDLAYVAAGRLDGFWEYGLSPWDTAAGYLLVEEAGGRVTDMDNGPFTAHESSVLATNGHIHDAMLRVLDEHKTH